MYNLKVFRDKGNRDMVVLKEERKEILIKFIYFGIFSGKKISRRDFILLFSLKAEQNKYYLKYFIPFNPSNQTYPKSILPPEVNYLI